MLSLIYQSHVPAINNLERSRLKRSFCFQLQIDTYINQNSKVKSANSSMDFCMNLTNNTWNSWSIENNGFHSEHISYFISRLCMAWLETNSTNLWYLGWHVVIVAVVIIATMLIPCIYHLNLGKFTRFDILVIN